LLPIRQQIKAPLLLYRKQYAGAEDACLYCAAKAEKLRASLKKNRKLLPFMQYPAKGQLLIVLTEKNHGRPYRFSGSHRLSVQGRQTA
jgi:hypothetical protein